jgi:DnaK suppressor protein
MANKQKTIEVTRQLISKKIVEQCKEKLLLEKENILNTLKMNGRPPDTDERAGDFGDQNNRAMNEHQWLLFQNRLRKQLVEVESALSRIESSNFGLCEETECPIETPRLLAIPWTRLSIEGARLRESSLK